MAFLENEFTNKNNQFLLSYYGNQNALGFKGDNQFIEKSYNLAYNYSITDGVLCPLQEGLSYILTNKEKIFKGIKSYFINELKVNHIVPLIKDCWNEDESEYLVEYNEEAIEKIAEEKSKNFIDKFIISDNFMAPLNKEINGQFYEMHSFMKKSVPSGRDTLNENIDVRDDV